jgi:hypothetical protein
VVASSIEFSGEGTLRFIDRTGARPGLGRLNRWEDGELHVVRGAVSLGDGTFPGLWHAPRGTKGDGRIIFSAPNFPTRSPGVVALYDPALPEILPIDSHVTAAFVGPDYVIWNAADDQPPPDDPDRNGLYLTRYPLPLSSP